MLSTAPDSTGRCCWFSLGLAVATGVLFGLYPAWDASRVTLAATLSDETGKSSSSRGSARLRKVLVCAQLTISIVLLIPTGLFLKSLVNLLNVNLGIRTDHVIGFSITPQWNGYTPAQSKSIFERAETGLAAIPGVRSAVGAEVPLIGGSNWGTTIHLEGRPAGDRGVNSKLNAVGPGFFSKAGIPLLAGREIRDTDTAASPKVIVVNETFVKQFLDGRYPVGLHVGKGRQRPSGYRRSSASSGTAIMPVCGRKFPPCSTSPGGRKSALARCLFMCARFCRRSRWSRRFAA